MPKTCREHSVTFKLWESNLLARFGKARSSLMALVCNLDQIGCSHHLVPINSSPALLSGNICICVRRPDGEKTTTEAQPQIRAIHYHQKITHLYTYIYIQSWSPHLLIKLIHTLLLAHAYPSPFVYCPLSLLDKRFSQGPLQSKRPVLMSTARRKSSVGMCPDSLPRVRTSIQPQERWLWQYPSKWSNDHPNQPSIWNLKLTLEMFISVTRMDCPFGAWLPTSI